MRIADRDPSRRGQQLRRTRLRHRFAEGHVPVHLGPRDAPVSYAQKPPQGPR
jgi:hypothetical protein